jgi:hypothetical protein
MAVDDTAPAGTGDYVVERGDGMSLIAFRRGFFWQTLWELPENGELKKARANPEVLLDGDRVTIPPLRMKKAACATGAVHRFRRKGVPSKVAFDVRQRDGTVFSGCRFRLTAGGRTIEGTTDDAGHLEQFVSPDVTRAELTVWLDRPGYPETFTWTLDVGQLDPAGTLRGVKARLTNLGYDVRSDGEELGPATTEALRAVQNRSGLEGTGVLDDATRDALVKLHGS